jgi:hypothetical protein
MASGMRRWLSIGDLVERALGDQTMSKNLVGKPRKRQLEIVRRWVRRSEEEGAIRLTKVVNNKLLVDWELFTKQVPRVGYDLLASLESETKTASLLGLIEHLVLEVRRVKLDLNQQKVTIRKLRQRVANLEATAAGSQGDGRS